MNLCPMSTLHRNRQRRIFFGEIQSGERRIGFVHQDDVQCQENLPVGTVWSAPTSLQFYFFIILQSSSYNTYSMPKPTRK